MTVVSLNSTSSLDSASWDRVGARYMQNFGTRILRGPNPTRVDNQTTGPVAIINGALAKCVFRSGEDPLDQHFGLDFPENAGAFRIVGIVHDANLWGLRWDSRRARALPLFLHTWAPSVLIPEHLCSPRVIAKV